MNDLAFWMAVTLIALGAVFILISMWVQWFRKGQHSDRRRS